MGVGFKSRPLAKKGDGENMLRTYRLFKDSFHFENYLDNVKIKKHRVALTRFRLSFHNYKLKLEDTIYIKFLMIDVYVMNVESSRMKSMLCCFVVSILSIGRVS